MDFKHLSVAVNQVQIYHHNHHHHHQPFNKIVKSEVVSVTASLIDLSGYLVWHRNQTITTYASSENTDSAVKPVS
jgi:hypothetical protein